MRILEWNRLDESQRVAALARPALAAHEDVVRGAREIIARVRCEGDDALRALTERLDGPRLQGFAVTPAEFTSARAELGEAQLQALTRALQNVRRFHEAQRPGGIALDIEPGVRCEQVHRPIDAVGLYVPAGSAPLPSSVIMLGVPAQLAGCPRRVLCTPPRADGSAHPAVLAAAELAGIDTVFKLGGAQAIAALAFGTQTIPRVDKIFGPGNAWVTAAKRLVAAEPGGPACDLPAGPSEVLVLADETAEAAFVAADLLAQAEHDVLSQALLATDSLRLATAVAREIERQLPGLARRAILARSLASCRALVVATLDDALALANRYAPEHLLLQVREPRRLLPQITHAGSIFLGPWSPETLGDYCSGTNHVLPTFGHARAWSGLGVRDFLKVISVQEISAAGLQRLGPTAVTLAGLEGLDAHASAVTRRLAFLAGTSKDARPAQVAR